MWTIKFDITYSGLQPLAVLVDQKWPTLIGLVGAVRRTMHHLAASLAGFNKSYHIPTTIMNEETGQVVRITFYRPTFFGSPKPASARCRMAVSHNRIFRGNSNIELYYIKDGSDHCIMVPTSRSTKGVHFGKKTLRRIQENVDSGVFQSFDLDTSIKMGNSMACHKVKNTMSAYAAIHLGRPLFLLKRTFTATSGRGQTWVTLAVDDVHPLFLMVTTDFDRHFEKDMDRYMAFAQLHVPHAESIATPVEIKTLDGDLAFVNFVIDNETPWSITNPSTQYLSFAFIDADMATLFQSGYNS